MGQQITKNIAFSPFVDKSETSTRSSKIEALLPKNLDIRNLVLSLNRNWRKRPGMSSARFSISENQGVPLIIPEFNTGYGVLSNGNIYRLDTLAKLTTGLSGADQGFGYHPMYDIYDDMAIIADGSKMVKIQNNQSSLLGGSPPEADIVLRVGNYTIAMKRGTNIMEWASAGNPQNWTSGDSGGTTLKEDGGTIQNATVVKQHIYVFKERTCEVWVFVGGPVQFARHESLSFDIGIEGAPNSLLKSTGMGTPVYWHGHTDDWYQLVNGAPKIISKLYDNPIKTITDKSHIYATDFYKENCVRIFEPLSGRCFRYDTIWDIITEDNIWDTGFERLPILSQAYFNGRNYVGGYDPLGKIYEWGNDFLDDNGQEIRCLKRAQIVVYDTGNKARINSIVFRLLRGTANSSEAAPKMMFRMKPGKGAWSKEYVFDLGAAWDKDPSILFHPKGPRIAREFEFEIVETDAVEFLITGMYVTFEDMGR